MENLDIIVIGGGPGGYTAALQGAKQGKRVALFEQGQLGGTCLNRGCIPTKALLRSSHLYHQAHTSQDCGVTVSDATYDMGKMHESMDATKTQLRGGIETLLNKQKVTVIQAKATITAPQTVEADGITYHAPHIIVAVGGKPMLPPIPGIDSAHVHTSDYFLEQPVDVKSLIIVGGGVIGVEMAEIYNRLGAQVTVLEGLPRLLPNLDKELGQSLAMTFKKRGIQAVTSAMVSAFASDASGTSCTYTDKKGNTETIFADKILVCIGRTANTKDVFAPEVTPEMTKGLLAVNDQFETSIPGIYAIGDIVLGGVQLAHVAEAQGVNVVCGLVGAPCKKDMDAIPSCVFTEPEIATVGLTADQAKEQGIVVKTVKKLTSANGRSLVEGAERGFAKLVVHADSGRLLGAALLCNHAGEMIGGLAMAIGQGLTLEQVESTIFPHPTISETIVSE